MEREHFPDPTGLRARIEQWTFGLYPACIKYLMSAFDVPEVIACFSTIWCITHVWHVLWKDHKTLFCTGYGCHQKPNMQERDGIPFPRWCNDLLRLRLPLFLGPVNPCCIIDIRQLLVHLYQLVPHTLRWSLLFPTDRKLQVIYPVPYHRKRQPWNLHSCSRQGT